MIASLSTVLSLVGVMVQVCRKERVGERELISTCHTEVIIEILSFVFTFIALRV